jgi:peptide/nickel transport system ATP-binding protein
VNPLLKVTNLHVWFDTPSGVVRANNGVNLEVREGESLGIMGESGCGKTVLFLSLLQLQQPGRITDGSVLLDGRELTTLPAREMERIRGREIALVPQNQATALNPAFTVRQQLLEALMVRRSREVQAAGAAGRGDPATDAREIAASFESLGFEAGTMLNRLLRSYPHQLSGGMRQRVLIAMALLMKPRLLIADEPTTALDRAVKEQAVAVLGRLRGSLTMLVISHDVEAIAGTCDRVAVMYGGRVIESGPCDAVLEQPLHPYSRLLLAAQRRTRGEPLDAVSAETLNLIDFPPGCAFHPVCPEAAPECNHIPPPEHILGGRRMVACHRRAEEASRC